jgi:CRP/FNR family transcriptional regulator, cyclic AMP receptor protein
MQVGRVTVNVLDLDPELGEDLEPVRLRRARALAVASTITLDPGEWDEPDWPAGVRTGPGLLVLEGLLLRRVGFDGRYGAELLAAGDLLRPWQIEDAITSVPRQSAWRVLRPSKLAQLDIEFARRLAAWPEINSRLIARAVRRSRELAVNMAIVHQPRVEIRVQMLLWHLADRWGKVGSDGVTVPVRLTHAVVAELVAARRPTVSAALRALARDGRVTRSGTSWLLRGTPPGELRALVRPPAPSEAREQQ